MKKAEYKGQETVCVDYVKVTNGILKVLIYEESLLSVTV
jgi:hypothetical protein